jgi:hypothetical protein
MQRVTVRAIREMKTVGFLRSFTLTFLTIAVALLFLMRASPALAAGKTTIRALTPAPNCLQDEFSLTATQKLNCTANDVRVAAVTNIRNTNGTPLPACNSGSTVNFLADFLVVTSSNSSRSNIGLYFGTAAQGTALTGTCTDAVIAPPHSCPTDSAVTCGSNHYDELDPQTSPDNCGDSSSTDPTVCLDSKGAVTPCPAPTGGSTFTGAQIVTVEIDNFLCSPPAGQTTLSLPNCTSWQVPGKTTVCEAGDILTSAHAYPFDASGKPEAIPGSPSKCNCGLLPLNIQIQNPTVSVTKNCTTANGSGTIPTPPDTTPAACTLTPEGGSVTYTVDVKNTANFGDVSLTQLCDSAYGNITATNSPTCAAGTVAAAPTSSTCALPHTILAGGDYSCTFTATQPESKVITNFVSASGVGASGGSSFGPTNSNSAQVTSKEADSSAAIIKMSSSATPTSGCATVRYSAEVSNSSLSGSDEAESLRALNDTVYGNIAAIQGNVLGTTCGVDTAAKGLGTLNGSNGAGAFPAAIAVGGNYTCQFDAKVCGDPLGALTIPPNLITCAAGVETKDTVSGTIIGDEPSNVDCTAAATPYACCTGSGTGTCPPEVVTQTGGSLTVDVCFSTSQASQ